MKIASMIAILIIAGLLGIVAALWSGSGVSLGPVRIMGAGETPSSTRYLIMGLAMAGGIGSLLAGFTIRLFRPKPVGIAALIFAALMVPSVFQANTLSIPAIILIAIVGITLLTRPSPETEEPTTE